MMLQTRSSVYKRLQDEAPKDNQITFFPKPYRIDATPYQELDFNPLVKDLATSVSMVSGLRISKAIIVGDVGVGKTSLVNRFCHKVFDSNYKATIGVDFEVERFDILGIPFHLQIWDTAGQERFKSIASSYYRGAHVIIITFDMTCTISLTHCLDWKREAMMVNNKSTFIFLVGTKRDLLRSPETFSKLQCKGRKVAADLGAELWCVSSRTGENISKMFQRIAALVFDQAILKDQEDRRPIFLGENLGSVRRRHSLEHQNCLRCA